MISESKALFGFISTGDKVAMYTLRIMYKHKVSSGGETSYFNRPEFIKILSNDKAKAETFADAICVDYGVEFRGNADFELNEIRRLRDEESKEKIEAFERELKAKQDADIEEFERSVNDGTFIVGKYTGKTAKEVYDVDIGYVFWLSEQDFEGISSFNVNIKIAKDYVEVSGIQKPGFVGEIDQPIELELTMKNISSFNSMYGVNFVFTCHTKTNEIVTFFSSSKKLLAIDIGDSFKITGTVKEQSVRRGVNQTLINRPKIVK